jgi:hypothetical protein
VGGLDRLWKREPELIGHSHATLRWRPRVRRCRGLRERGAASAGAE